MAEYMRYDDNKALDERGRIDVVDAGASVGGGGGLVVNIIRDGETAYLDIEAGKLWTALHNSVVSFVGEREKDEGVVMYAPQIETASKFGEEYVFDVQSHSFTAESATDKPSYSEGGGGAA